MRGLQHLGMRIVAVQLPVLQQCCNIKYCEGVSGASEPEEIDVRLLQQ